MNQVGRFTVLRLYNDEIIGYRYNKIFRFISFWYPLNLNVEES